MKSYQIFMALAQKVGKDRRGGFIYKKDKQGREILNRALYDPFSKSTILDFLPIVETTGRIIDDELPRITNLYHQFQKEK